MEQAQARVQHVGQYRQRRAVVGLQAHLGHLDIPVAELPPEEIMDLATGLAHLRSREQLSDIADHPVQPRHDPAVLQRHVVPRARLRWLHRLVRQAGDDEASGVPDLVGEVATAL